MSVEPLIGAVVPWFGGKRRMASMVIVPELGEHQAYDEPFCGGLSVVMAKPQVSYEMVNDLHGDLTHLAETRSGFAGDGAQSRYLHEFEAGSAGIFGHVDDHSRLAELLARFRHARVVVSYYAHPRLEQLYSGWTVVDCAQNKAMANGARGRQPDAKAESPEVLLINGPSYTGGGQ